VQVQVRLRATAGLFASRQALTGFLHSVVWSSGRVLRKRYTTAPVFQARCLPVPAATPRMLTRGLLAAGRPVLLPRQCRDLPLPAARRQPHHLGSNRRACRLSLPVLFGLPADVSAPGCAGETHTVQLQAPLSPQELGTRHHPGLLWPTPLGLVLQRFTGGGPHGVQLHALLNPVDSTTRVDLPDVRLHWSSPTLPLVRAQTRVLLVVKQGHSQAGSSESQVVGCTSDTVQLLRVEQAPLDPGLPVGVQSRRLACACLWDGVLVRLDAVGWLGGVLR
jgi:hypothetical protein